MDFSKKTTFITKNDKLEEIGHILSYCYCKEYLSKPVFKSTLMKMRFPKGVINYLNRNLNKLFYDAVSLRRFMSTSISSSLSP